MFLALLGSVAWLLADRGADVPALLAAALLALLLGTTAFGAAPLHTRLGPRFDPAVHRRLLRWDTARVAVAAAQLALALSLTT